MIAILPFLLLWVQDVPEERIVRLLRDLDDGDIQTREKASEQLTKVGVPVLPRLRKAALEETSEEVRARIATIIKKLEVEEILTQAKFKEDELILWLKEIPGRGGAPELQRPPRFSLYGDGTVIYRRTPDGNPRKVQYFRAKLGRDEMTGLLRSVIKTGFLDVDASVNPKLSHESLVFKTFGGVEDAGFQTVGLKLGARVHEIKGSIDYYVHMKPDSDLLKTLRQVMTLLREYSPKEGKPYDPEAKKDVAPPERK